MSRIVRRCRVVVCNSNAQTNKHTQRQSIKDIELQLLQRIPSSQCSNSKCLAVAFTRRLNFILSLIYSLHRSRSKSKRGGIWARENVHPYTQAPMHRSTRSFLSFLLVFPTSFSLVYGRCGKFFSTRLDSKVAGKRRGANRTGQSRKGSLDP